VLAGPPNHPVDVPTSVRRIIGARSFEVVWLNGLGGLTFRIEDPARNLFLKWTPTSSGIDLDAERSRMNWARTFTPVPRVIEAGNDEYGSWMMSEEMGADHAASKRATADPRNSSIAVGLGLRALHDALPVATCPFDWSARRRRHDVAARAASGELDSVQWGEGFDGPDLDSALVELADIPNEDLVVCHGDACVPNTVIDDAGNWVAHVDLGNLGVGDRWADLAVASWSTIWNYGAGWEAALYDSYGIAPDEEKIRFYRILWGLE
jgi:kanamycin kinase